MGLWVVRKGLARPFMQNERGGIANWFGREFYRRIIFETGNEPEHSWYPFDIRIRREQTFHPRQLCLLQPHQHFQWKSIQQTVRNSKDRVQTPLWTSLPKRWLRSWNVNFRSRNPTFHQSCWRIQKTQFSICLQVQNHLEASR